MLQIESLKKDFDELQSKFGDKDLQSIFGAGKIFQPKVMYIFMNPTGRNITSKQSWKGIRAPWLGTTTVWKMLLQLGAISQENFEKIIALKPDDWSEQFAFDLYSEISKNGVYITNFAKCTQIDARPLSNTVFKEYKSLLLKEIELINPLNIVSFGNQVSSLLLDKNISVSQFSDSKFEILSLTKEYKVYPTYYPVGQGQRNMPLAITRIKSILLSS